MSKGKSELLGRGVPATPNPAITTPRLPDPCFGGNDKANVSQRDRRAIDGTRATDGNKRPSAAADVTAGETAP